MMLLIPLKLQIANHSYRGRLNLHLMARCPRLTYARHGWFQQYHTQRRTYEICLQLAKFLGFYKLEYQIREVERLI